MPPKDSPIDSEEQVLQRQSRVQPILIGEEDALEVVKKLLARADNGEEDRVVVNIVQELPRVEKSFDYSNREKIGHGGYGLVFKVMKWATREMAALKVAPASGYALNELVALCKLLKVRSPYLAEYRGAYVDQKLNLVLEMPLYGMNLAALWARRWKCNVPFTEREILELARQMTEAVRACHAENFFHRDIKPENFVCEKGTDISKIRLLDFSFVTHSLEGETLRVGSQGFVAPDVFRYLHCWTPYDYRVDIFSLGVSIRTLALLAQPTARKVLKTRRWLYSKELRKLVEEMTDSDRDQRPSLDSVLERINKMLANSPKSPPIHKAVSCCTLFSSTKQLVPTTQRSVCSDSGLVYRSSEKNGRRLSLPASVEKQKNGTVEKCEKSKKSASCPCLRTLYS